MKTQKKIAVNFLRKLITSLNIDETLSAKLAIDSPLRKALPKHTHFKAENYKIKLKDGLYANIDRSDYTQWRLYAGSLSVSKEILKRLSEKKDVVIFDIGANIGLYSILLAADITKKSEIHFFEPNPYIFDKLMENINNFQKWNPESHCFVNQLGVGEKEYKIGLSFSESHTGKASVVSTHNTHIDQVIEVDITSLDHYLATKAVRKIDFLKIDVESFEPSVFKGAKKTIENFKPLIYFEYSIKWFNNYSDSDVQEILDLLSGVNYSILIEKAETFKPFNLTVESLKRIKYANFLAVQI